MNRELRLEEMKNNDAEVKESVKSLMIEDNSSIYSRKILRSVYSVYHLLFLSYL